MARRERLRLRRPIRFAGLAALVLAAHLVAVDAVSRLLQGPPRLHAMAEPMFTRVLEPEAPAPLPDAAAAPPPATESRAIAIVRRAPAHPPRAAASAAAAARRKRREEEAVAQADAAAAGAAEPATAAASSASAPASAAASAPEATASAPSAEASSSTAAASSPASAAAASASSASAAFSAASAASQAQAAASGASAPARLDSWPADTRLSYQLTGSYNGPLTGTARVQWLRRGDRYEARVDLDLGLFAMHFLSQGEVGPASLSPRAYEESRPGRTRIVQLSPDSVVLNDGRTVPRPPGTQDTASHFVELSHRFATGQEKLALGGTTSMYLARPGGVDLWTYDVVSLDRLQTQRYGAVAAYHLKPRPVVDARGNIYAEVWLAPSLQYLPVRIRLTQGEQSYVDILVDRIELR